MKRRLLLVRMVSTYQRSIMSDTLGTVGAALRRLASPRESFSRKQRSTELHVFHSSGWKESSEVRVSLRI